MGAGGERRHVYARTSGERFGQTTNGDLGRYRGSGLEHPHEPGKLLMNEALHTAVCIVGGGPAGIVLALLLARQGIEVIVLEKHKDFNRDFRGDTIHGATLRVMQEARPARRTAAGSA